jgi:hypothetical protein
MTSKQWFMSTFPAAFLGCETFVLLEGKFLTDCTKDFLKTVKKKRPITTKVTFTSVFTLK